MAAMEKTLKYRNNEAYRETFTLDPSEMPAPDDAGHEIVAISAVSRRSSLPCVERSTPSVIAAASEREWRQSSYGTIS